MPRKHPDKITVPGTPPVVVTLVRRSEGKDHASTGNWFFVFYWKGERCRGTTGSADKATAFAIAAAEARKAMTGSPAEGAHMTLAQAVDQSVATRWPGANYTNRSYNAKNRLKKFVTSAGTIQLATLSPEGATRILQRYLDQMLSEGRAPETINTDRRHVSGFFTWLRIRKLVSWPINPAAKHLLNVPVVPRKISAPLTDAEVSAALQAARPKAVFPALVLCLSGFRPCGTQRVLWSDIDLKHQRATVMEKSRTRTIPLSDWATSELKTWKAKNAPTDTDQVFDNCQAVLYRAMGRIRKAKGCARVSLQALRRACEYRLWEEGVSPQLSARILGHSVQTAARHYVDLETMDAKPAVNVLNFAPRPHKRPHEKASKHATA